jgi:hypothetical protein
MIYRIEIDEYLEILEINEVLHDIEHNWKEKVFAPRHFKWYYSEYEKS